MGDRLRRWQKERHSSSVFIVVVVLEERNAHGISLYKRGSRCALGLQHYVLKSLLSHLLYSIIWLGPGAGKMKRILCSDWLSKRERWANLARLGLPALFPQKRNSLLQYFDDIINPL